MKTHTVVPLTVVTYNQCSNYRGGRGGFPPHWVSLSPPLFVFLASPRGTEFVPGTAGVHDCTEYWWQLAQRLESYHSCEARDASNLTSKIWKSNWCDYVNALLIYCKPKQYGFQPRSHFTLSLLWKLTSGFLCQSRNAVNTGIKQHEAC